MDNITSSGIWIAKSTYTGLIQFLDIDQNIIAPYDLSELESIKLNFIYKDPQQINILYFSRGNHLYDQYMDECPYHYCQLDNIHVIAIQYPSVLRIRNLADLEHFTEKYRKIYPDSETCSRIYSINKIENDERFSAFVSRNKIFQPAETLAAFCDIDPKEIISIIFNFSETNSSTCLKKYLKQHIHNDDIDEIDLEKFTVTLCYLIDYFKLLRLKSIPPTFIKDYSNIDWSNVYLSGNPGVSFEFPNLATLNIPRNEWNTKYLWYTKLRITGETLLVWDTKNSFNNIVYPCTLKL